MAGITLDFETEWAQAPSPLDDAATSVYPISLNGVGYMLDFLAEPSRTSVDVVQTRVNTFEETSQAEGLLLPPEVWRRARESWHQGDKQTAGDRADSLPYRWNTSRGVDPFTKWQVSLLKDTTQKVAVTGTAPFCQVVNGWLAVVDGTSLKWYQTAVSSAVSETLPAAAVSVTSNGATLFIALADGTIRKSTPGVASTSYATLANVSLIAYAKEFLIAAANNVLYTLDAAGASTTVRTHPLTTYRWVAVAEGPAHIYLLGGQGDAWSVVRCGITTAGTALDVPVSAAPLPDGETGYSLGSYMGYLFVGTDQGMRFGAPDGTGNVNLGPLIATSSPVRCFEGQGRWVWFGLTNVDGTATGLGRVDLTTFTETLAPASASDLMASGQGNVTSVTTWLGKRVFTVAQLGCYVESDNLVSSGYLVESDLNFSIPDTKIAHYARLRCKPLTGGQARLELSYDDGAWVDVASVIDVGDDDSDNSYLDGKRFGKVAARIRLLRDATDATKGPTVTRWEMRCEPVTGKGSEWVLPIVIADEVEVDGVMQARDVDADLAALIGLAQSGQVVIYREGVNAYQVHVVKYQHKAMRRSRGSGFQGTLTLLVREVK